VILLEILTDFGYLKRFNKIAKQGF